MKPRKPLKRTTRPRRARKTPTAKLGRACDKLWSQIVRRRGFCEVCGRVPPAVVLQGAHGFSRRYRATRWLLINGFALCSGCHVRLTHDPLAWTQHLEIAWGEPVYEELREIAQSGQKPDLEATHAALKAEWERV